MTDIELLLAQAMCGCSTRAPCRYHVAQAKVALNALAGAEMAIVGGVDHMDPIETEARAYVEAWRPVEPFIVPSYSYLIGLLAVLDARDAEIARLTEQNHFFQVQYQDEAGINALSEQLVAAKAAIARLLTLPGADVMERAQTILNELGGLTDAPDEIVCQESLLKNDIAVALQQYGDERAADAEARAVGDAPGADVVQRAKRLIVELCGGESVRDDDSDIIPTARALQQYGDERAAAAIESLREPTVAMRIAGDHFEGDTVGTWRAMFSAALAAKPGSP